MAGRMITFKLSPGLLDKIDYATEHAGCSVGGLLVKAFGKGPLSREDRDEFRRLTRRSRVAGPFTSKVSFRVSRETARKLRALGGRRLSRAQAARFLFAHFLPARPAEIAPRVANVG